MWRYRVHNTELLATPLTYQPAGCNPLPSWFGFCLVLATFGLALPWVVAAAIRRRHACSRTPHGPLEFTGWGLGIAWYGVLSAFALPWVVATLGLLGIAVRYTWLRWEQDNLKVPVGEGRFRETTFEGTLFGYARRVIFGWLFTVLTLGLYRPWALVAAWRWTAEHTRFEEEEEQEAPPGAEQDPGAEQEAPPPP
jgi:uncharacterized membrane protein YjgN (DUF898 family)